MKITFRMWVLFTCVMLSIIAIFSIPPMIFAKGVVVSSVDQNSTIFESGLREGMTILSINGNTIETNEDYSTAMEIMTNLPEGQTQKLTIQTDSIEIINLFTNEIIDDISVQEIPSGDVAYPIHSPDPVPGIPCHMW